jgi:hypothetical protein
VQTAKKTWTKPRVEPVEIAEMRARILGALRLIEKDPTLAEQCAELRSILQTIDKMERDKGAS